MDEKVRLVRQLDEARAELQAALEQASAGLEVYPGWTIHQVLAHITGWDDAVTCSLRAHAGGQEPAVPAGRGIDAYNAHSVATREGLGSDRLWAEWEQAREQLKAAIDAMPAVKFQEALLLPWGQVGTIDQLVAIFRDHELEHAREIRQRHEPRSG
jgi:hypothetical protein